MRAYDREDQPYRSSVYGREFGCQPGTFYIETGLIVDSLHSRHRNVRNVPIIDVIVIVIAVSVHNKPTKVILWLLLAAQLGNDVDGDNDGSGRDNVDGGNGGDSVRILIEFHSSHHEHQCPGTLHIQPICNDIQCPTHSHTDD
uniref:Uncharacterized protein n=1 Tax=Glossina palpalis gambiensis TaxID=67801 RepID=A0A1B0BET4_9MUSC